MNALRVVELRIEHFGMLANKVSKDKTGEFSIEKSLRIYPTNNQDYNHNKGVLKHFIEKGTVQDQLINARGKEDNTNLDKNYSNNISIRHR